VDNLSRIVSYQHRLGSSCDAQILHKLLWMSTNCGSLRSSPAGELYLFGILFDGGFQLLNSMRFQIPSIMSLGI
jgi:hypothetical protein